ncbi:hypothetical protein OQA88_11652 [Cercophora sp. LCS_1]
MAFGITLNTLLAFLTSLAKVAFLVPIVEGLGQLKWMWLHSRRRRPLIDLQVFDVATRGGLGGVKLLFGFKGFLASFGAIIMISGLFTSTLTQQAIDYPLILAESHGPSRAASIHRATTFSVYDGHGLAITPYDTAREQRAIFQGAFSGPQEVVPDVQPSCSSSECTWSRYGSVTICGDVANITAMQDKVLLETLGKATEKRLGVLFNASRATAEALGFGDFYLGAVTQVLPIVVGLLGKPTGAFNQSVNQLLASDGFVAYTDDLIDNADTFDMTKFKCLEVAFWWCTKAYSTEVKEGQARTVEVSTRSQLKGSEVPPPLDWPWNPDFYPCYTTGTCNKTFGAKEVHLEPPPGIRSEEVYSLHLWSELAASALIAAVMFDSVFVDRTRGVVASNGGGIAKAFGLSISGDFMTTEPPPPNVQMANMKSLITNTARSLTNLVREGNTRLNETDGSAIVTGVVMTPQSFVRIRWEWLAMLIAQLALTALFLLLTMSSSHREEIQVIKCSSLATLCALDEGARREIGGLDDLRDLTERAKRSHVRLDCEGSAIALRIQSWDDAISLAFVPAVVLV